MSHDTTLHIKVPSNMALGLKHLAKQRDLSVAELVRLALNSCYQIETLGLKANEKRALEAYRGGYISLDKLAQEMGLYPIDMRQWLQEHEIPQNISFNERDVDNA